MALLKLLVVAVAVAQAIGCQSLCAGLPAAPEAARVDPAIRCARESVDRNGDGVVDQRDCLGSSHRQGTTYVGWQECDSCHSSRDAARARAAMPIGPP